MPLFEVAIIEVPTPKMAEEGKGERLVMAPKAVLASDAQAAGIVAVMDAGAMEVDKTRMKVMVRPFA